VPVLDTQHFDKLID